MEEPSLEAYLRILVPRIIGDISFEIFRFQGKNDLLAKLPSRLRGYSKWIDDGTKLVVVVDRDGSNCRDLKGQLENIAIDAGLNTRSSKSYDGSYSVVNRIIIEELEAWHFGSWDAVLAAYPRLSPKIPRRAKFRDPDAVTGGTWEAFEREMKKAGYFNTGLRKIEVARAIAEYVDPARSSSKSFCHFRDALIDVVT